MLLEVFSCCCIRDIYISDLNSIFTLGQEQKLCCRLFLVETLVCKYSFKCLSSAAANRECFLSSSSSCSHSAKLIETNKQKKLLWIGSFFVCLFSKGGLNRLNVHLPYFILRFKEGEQSGRSSVKSLLSLRLKGLLLLFFSFSCTCVCICLGSNDTSGDNTRKQLLPTVDQHLRFKLALQTGSNEH